MSNIEHYFENLLFEGKDCNGEPNKKSLSPEVQEAVETCAAYVTYSMFWGREELVKFLRKEPAKWIEQPLTKHSEEYIDVCSACGNRALAKYNYCPNCGAEMIKDE